MSKMNNQDKIEVLTSIKVTEDVRDWINEVRDILRKNIQKPSLSQNETLRWMCAVTIEATTAIVEENHKRRQNVLFRTTQPLDIERLRSRSAVSFIREEELSLESTKQKEQSPAEPKKR
jgi:hypothetical protein